jgi:Protein of unknown function (DUF1524)
MRVFRPISATAVALSIAAAGALLHHHAAADPAATAPAASVQQFSELITKVTVVKDIPDITGYQRGCKKGEVCSFGPAWNDPSSHSGCDTRNTVLAAQLHDVSFKPGTRNCKVIAGWVTDPYTGQRITLQQTQIDHIYPLHRAYNAGAAQWPLARRQQFANDRRNLLAVSAHANESKGDDGPGKWLPPNPGERCPYVVGYLSVAVAYGLPISTADKGAAIGVCGSKGAP